jgi:PEP-CTERM motif-containing protein
LRAPTQVSPYSLVLSFRRVRRSVSAHLAQTVVRVRPTWIPLLALLLGGSATAATVPCPVGTTLDVLLAFNNPGNGCFSQDVLFYGFQYAPGGNATPASGVAASLVLQTGDVDVHGWNFSDSWSQSGSTLANFTLSYSIEVCPSGQPCTGNVSPGTFLTAADAVYAPVSVFPPGPTTVEWSNGATVTLTSASPGPLPGNGNIGLGAGTIGPVTVTESFSGSGAITQTSLRFYTNSPPVPEPATLTLVTAGLACTAAWGRRRPAVALRSRPR